jgi:hypothetical protein
MNKSEAQALTAQIRSTAHGLWRLVAEAYDRKAWQALGYSGWKEYAEVELQMSESRSYQLVDTGRVMKAIGEVAGSEEVFETIVVTARETAKIKPHMSTFKRSLESYLKDGIDTADAVGYAIESLPVTEPRHRAPREADIVIDGQVIEVKGSRELPEIIPASSGGKREAVAIPVPLFTGGTQIDQPIKPPRGKKVCSHCEGRGYV